MRDQVGRRYEQHPWNNSILPNPRQVQQISRLLEAGVLNRQQIANQLDTTLLAVKLVANQLARKKRVMSEPAFQAPCVFGEARV